MTSWIVFCGFYEVKSSGSQLHGIIFASNINLFIFDVKVMLMHCVLMTFSAHIISQWFLCLKCSLVCVCYGRKRLYHAQSRGFVAPNTGDRLCGSTACEWAYKVSLVIQNSPSLMFNARVCQPLLFMFRLPGPGISAVSHAATWPWKWLSLWSARSSRVEFNRVGGDDSNRLIEGTNYNAVVGYPDLYPILWSVGIWNIYRW